MKQKGFTLIELLVVISVIGLLSSVVLVSMNNARNKSRYTKALADLSQIGKAAEMYNNNSTTGYPADVGPDVLPPEIAPYLSRWPKPPCNGWTYDWEKWINGNNVYIRTTMRRTDVASVYFYCHSSNASDCGASYGGGVDITTVTTKQLTCGE